VLLVQHQGCLVLQLLRRQENVRWLRTDEAVRFDFHKTVFLGYSSSSSGVLQTAFIGIVRGHLPCIFTTGFASKLLLMVLLLFLLLLATTRIRTREEISLNPIDSQSLRIVT